MKDNIPNKTRKAKISIPATASSIKPGDNFYKYVNASWLRNASIPPYSTSFGVSEEVELMIDSQLSEILKRAYTFSEKGSEAHTKREKMMDLIGRFLLSALRLSKQANSVSLLKKNTRALICTRDSSEVAYQIGNFNRQGIPTFFSVSILHKGPFILISPGSLGLPDSSYYDATAPGKSRTLLSYVNLCEEVANKLHIENFSGGVQAETEMAPYIDNTQDVYIDLSSKEALRSFPGIPWASLFEAYGITEWEKHTLRIYKESWLKQVEKWLKTWPLEKWTTLFTLHMIFHALPVLPHPFNTLHFELFGKALRGQEEKLPQKELALNLCKTLLRIPLSFLYKEDFINSSLKEDATQFTNNIQTHAVNHLKKVDWLEEKTKALAIEKVKKMTFQISHPSVFPEIDAPCLITDNFLANLYLLGEMNTRVLVRRLEPDIKDIWDEAPYVVNAYYFNETNKFVLPAGTLQWPFYKKGALGWNYGGLGAIIGHEMTHAFDTDGKEYTAEGEKSHWWSKKDNRRYKKRTDSLVKLFSAGRILGHPVDGDLTLSENLADLGGLGIALDALNQELVSSSEATKKKELRDFFIAYAVSWRIKERPRKAIQGLFMDVHAPAELRVNYIVSQFDLWYELFGIVTGDDLYVAPEDRIIVF